jgi:hypothetical protein
MHCQWLQPWKRISRGLEAFYAAGYGTTSTRNHPWIVSKVISNYTNHIANTPVDGVPKICLEKNNITR